MNQPFGVSADGPLSVVHNLQWAVLEETARGVWLVVRLPTFSYKGAGIQIDDIDLARLRPDKRLIILNPPSHSLAPPTVQTLPPRITRALGL